MLCKRFTHGAKGPGTVGMVTDARIPCTRGRRDELQALKRGGETYDELLAKMIEQYDPDEATGNETPATVPDGGTRDE